MIRLFLRERLSWIVFFLLSQLLVLFVAYLDPSIPIRSLGYITLLASLLFLVFLFWRYQRETAFLKKLEEWGESYELEPLGETQRPMERMILERISRQNDFFKQERSGYLIEVEREKDDLLSWIHEVKTPLTAMRLMIDRLPDEALRGRLMYEWLRVHLLLDQQLHQRRIAYIRNDLYIGNCNLEEILYKEIRELQSWCMQKGIGFDLGLSSEDRQVLSDAKWLGFILRQLLSNAVKYSDSSDILIQSGQRDGHTLLNIQDFGLGITPHDLPRIFEKGFTSTSRGRDVTGMAAATGMGLYLARKAADSLLISIEVRSEPGQGSTFTLVFPEENEIERLRSM
ncbi:sensor histidine kinase [Paenibacillus sp. CN-4]|uniref:sensor histidine kinase n=1 Tax=Paenibacillus nanchangensis TaxID=3348343 RepID=UPI00397DBE7A